MSYRERLRQLPLVSPMTLLAGRQLVIVAPHPDDESLGVGGLLAAASFAGHAPTVIFLTDGEASHRDSVEYPPARLGATRRVEAIDALCALGVPSTCAHFLGLGDSALPHLGTRAIDAVRARLRDLMPSGDALICVTADTDPHGDHQTASRIVNGMRRPAGVDVMHYPVWTWSVEDAALPLTAPRGFRIDITRFLDAKRAAIAAHRSQHGLVVTDAAEAFELDPAFVERFLEPAETLTWPA